MFEKILVANRGEIAVRIIRACKELGIRTLAVYSEVDADSLHVQLADEAICIGKAPSSESYLKIDRIISAAEVGDVEAIHPGYGFLAENAHFAEVCENCNIEFQILADRKGKVLHLGERDCSLQRRHQKLLEESPSPALTSDMRKKMGKAAVKAAECVHYVNAGTIEMLLDSSGNFYFIEMNTRIQVEHPVTEEVTGIDIVKEQIRIAAGEELDLDQKDLLPQKAAIECRINAEDPFNNFQPCPGRIEFMCTP